MENARGTYSGRKSTASHNHALLIIGHLPTSNGFQERGADLQHSAKGLWSIVQV